MNTSKNQRRRSGQRASPSDDESGQWVYVNSTADGYKNVYAALAPWQKELIARKWLRSEGLFWGADHRLRNCFFSHLASCCRQPAGRADGSRGSQQCSFEMEIPHKMCLGILGITVLHFETHFNARYNINENGELEWKRANTIDSFFMDDMSRMSEWISLETREASKHLAVFGSSKGVVVREHHGVRVVATLIPPFIIELCHRAHDRLVLAVTFNLFTFNDRNGLDLPPGFPYARGEREKFRQLAINNIMGMVNQGVKMSKRMQTHLPPAYRDEEMEGEETVYSEEEEEAMQQVQD